MRTAAFETRDNTISNKRRTRRRAVLGMALLGLATQAAHAVPGAVNFQGDLAFNHFPPNPIHVVGFGNVDQLTGPGGRLRLESGLTPSPFVLASVPDIRDNYYGRVAGRLTYEFEIAAPSDRVDVLAFARGEVQGGTVEASLSNSGFALRSQWALEHVGSGATIFSEGIETPQLSGSFFDSFDSVTPLSLFVGQLYRVVLYADVAIANGTSNGGIGSAHAFVDPVFSFASNMGSEYSFLFSEGVGNSRGSGPYPDPNPNPVPVPEPGTLALLAFGLIALGVFRKRSWMQLSSVAMA